MSALLLLSVALIVAGAVAVLLLHASSALLLSLGVASAVFAGNTKYMGFTIPPDRILMAVGLFLLLVGIERRNLPFCLRFRSQHVLMLILAAYAIVNAIVAGSLGRGGYALLDRLSITAWVLFSVAPLVFHDRSTRNTFLVVMVVPRRLPGRHRDPRGRRPSKPRLPPLHQRPDVSASTSIGPVAR